MKSALDSLTRRGFLRRAPAGTAALLAAGATPLLAAPRQQEDEEVPVTPGEDLMREHGVLKRILLIYDEIIRRIHARQDFPPETLLDSATIIRTFIEEYHEKLEEEHLFPRFRNAGRLVSLVDVLQAQHHAGRDVTARILSLAKSPVQKNAADGQKLAGALHSFVRMYAPHEAREDTVLFPALAKIMSHEEYDALGEQFEDVEHEKFGAHGFESMVDKVAGIEKQLGIYDLAQFTPK